ncbi:hypothetical protein P7C70_g532, partial [Phenoliferia sp. Uapishka_3]
MFSILNFITPILPSFLTSKSVNDVPQPTLIRIQVDRSPAFAPTQVDTTLAVALPQSNTTAPQISLGFNLTPSEYEFWMRMGPSAISTSESRRSNCSSNSSMTSRSLSIASYSSRTSSSSSSSRQSSRTSSRASSRTSSTKSLSPPPSPKKSGFFSSQAPATPSNIRTTSGGLPTSGNCILTEEEFDEEAFLRW